MLIRRNIFHSEVSVRLRQPIRLRFPKQNKHAPQEYFSLWEQIVCFRLRSTAARRVFVLQVRAGARGAGGGGAGRPGPLLRGLDLGRGGGARRARAVRGPAALAQLLHPAALRPAQPRQPRRVRRTARPLQVTPAATQHTAEQGQGSPATILSE